MENLLVIGIGGFIGANLRYLVSVWAVGQFGSAFPWGTVLINFSGSCLLAVFMAFAANHVHFDPRLRLLVATGFFGAFTTFSTFAYDSITLLRVGDWLGAAGNILGTNLLCLGGAALGFVIGSRL